VTPILTNIPTFVPTGLLTRDDRFGFGGSRFIYGTFVRDRRAFNGRYPTKWKFFVDTEGQCSWTASPIANVRPKKLLHYEVFEDLMYNPEIQCHIDMDHILEPGTNARLQEAIPQQYAETDDAYRMRLRTELSEAVDRMLMRVQDNYGTVVPQLYNHQLQLLLPLSFDHGMSTPLAIPVTKQLSNNPANPDPRNPFHWEYRGATVLKIAMAYNNARLLRKVESEWLRYPNPGGGSPSSAGAGAGAGARTPPTLQSLLEMIDALKPTMSPTEKNDVSSRMYAP